MPHPRVAVFHSFGPCSIDFGLTAIYQSSSFNYLAFTIPAFRLAVIPAWSLISPTLSSISFNHLGHISDVYSHLPDHGHSCPVC